MAAYFQGTVEYNRRIVQSFLEERTGDLKLVAYTHSFRILTDPSNLEETFQLLNRGGSCFTDLSVIGKDGCTRLTWVHTIFGPTIIPLRLGLRRSWKKVCVSAICLWDIRKIPHFVMRSFVIKGAHLGF